MGRTLELHATQIGGDAGVTFSHYDGWPYCDMSLKSS
jgi:hypothetical protein